MPTKNSKILSLRIRNKTLVLAEELAAKQGKTLHAWAVELINREVVAANKTPIDMELLNKERGEYESRN